MANLPVVFRYNTLESLYVICHITYVRSSWLNVVCMLFAPCSPSILFQLSIDVKVNDMVLNHVKFGSDGGSGECRTVVSKELIDIRLCGEHTNITSCLVQVQCIINFSI